MFRTPMTNLYMLDLPRSLAFYLDLGFVETFRTPQYCQPAHVEVTLDGFTIGIATVDAAIADRGLRPQLNGRAIESVPWTDDTEAANARLTAAGAQPLAAARLLG